MIYLASGILLIYQLAVGNIKYNQTEPLKYRLFVISLKLFELEGTSIA